MDEHVSRWIDGAISISGNKNRGGCGFENIVWERVMAGVICHGRT